MCVFVCVCLLSALLCFLCMVGPSTGVCTHFICWRVVFRLDICVNMSNLRPTKQKYTKLRIESHQRSIERLCWSFRSKWTFNLKYKNDSVVFSTWTITLGVRGELWNIRLWKKKKKWNNSLQENVPTEDKWNMEKSNKWTQSARSQFYCTNLWLYVENTKCPGSGQHEYTEAETHTLVPCVQISIHYCIFRLSERKIHTFIIIY